MKSNKKTRLVEIHVADRAPFHLALASQPPAFEVARFLLRNGCKVDIIDSKGLKPQISLLHK